MASIRSSLSEAARTSEVVPSYVDLLFVVRVLELERIGDHATNIAKDSFWRDQAGEIREPTGQRWNPKRYLHYPYPGAFRGIAISKEPAIILRAPRSHLYSSH